MTCFLIESPLASATPDLAGNRGGGNFGYAVNTSSCGAGDGTGLDAADLNKVLYALQSFVEAAGEDDDCDLNTIIERSVNSILPNDITNQLLSTVIAAPSGLSAGQWVKPNGRAATLAEIAQSAGTGVEVPVEAMNRIWTDAATEGATAGNMNSDGILGHRSDRIIISVGGARIEPLFNGGYAYCEAINGGQVTPLGAPRYDGQIIYLNARSNIEISEYFTDMVCDVNVLGVARDTDGSNEITSSRSDPTSFRMRNGESAMLIGQGNGLWRIWPSSFNFLSGVGNGANYKENPDGTYDIWGEKFGQLSPNAGANQQLVSGDSLPFAITNFETVRVQVTGTRADEGFVVSGSTGRTNRTATDIPIYANYRNGPPLSAVAVEWYVSGAIRA